MRGRSVAAAVIAFAVAGGAGAACTRCAVDCSPDSEAVILQATVLDRDGDLVTFELDDGTVQNVRVVGRPDALDEGDAYRVPVFQDTTGPPTAQLALACSCGPSITHADGAPVDTRILGGVDWRLLGYAVIGGFGVLAAIWAGVRWFRGEPL